MPRKSLITYETPHMQEARMVLGFSGWMDGGDVSTGVVEYLGDKLQARKVAEILPDDFYIYNFPGSMEISSLFRPHVRMDDGVLLEYEEPANDFFCDPENKLVLFNGKEPNLHWKEYADNIFAAAEALNVTRLYFVGSVAGAVPHTREPRFGGSVSHDGMKPLLLQHALRPSNYEGPASLITYLLREAPPRNIEMMTVVAEIPSYIQGRNIKCIKSAVRKLGAMLGLSLNLDDLKLLTDEFERRLQIAVEQKSELAELIKKIEADYDSELLVEPEEDVRDWFEKQNIRLDE